MTASKIDYRFCLKYSNLAWDELAEELNISPKDCYQQYWNLVGISEQQFKKEIVGKKFAAKYARIEAALNSQQQTQQQELSEPTSQSNKVS